MFTKKKFKLFHFELYHFILILLIIILSQILIPIINNRAIDNYLNRTIDLYRWDVAERIADQTTVSLELFFYRLQEMSDPPETLQKATVEAIDMIIFQQKLQRSIDDFCIILGKKENIKFYEDGASLYSAIINKKTNDVNQTGNLRHAIKDWYKSVAGKIFDDELIQYRQEGNLYFHFLVPFSMRGEVIGALFMKINPDLSEMESSIVSSFQQSGLLFSLFILLCLFGLFLMTTFLLRERDQAQELLYQKREKRLTKEIENRKEEMFVRRIYHAHHKVEKIIGFVKKDLTKWPENIHPDISQRVNKYMNFIGRVIYGMKTANPPVQVIRNISFNTDINFLIRFIIDNIFRRVYKEGDQYLFNLNLNKDLPLVHVNEYVIWEIFEPLINNAIEHNKNHMTTITISSHYNKPKKEISVAIKDNGVGIKTEFLTKDESGIRKIFKENISDKDNTDNSGYGCYIAYENCKRCGWKLDVLNHKDGAEFLITIPVD